MGISGIKSSSREKFAAVARESKKLAASDSDHPSSSRTFLGFIADTNIDVACVHYKEGDGWRLYVNAAFISMDCFSVDWQIISIEI